MPTIVETGLGQLEGFEKDGVRVFRGIPFAKPPTGERRFCAPEKPEAWTGARAATEYGNAAPQPPLMLAALPGFDIGAQHEDCLYLNVYTPNGASGRDRKPVMVWIHGGGFVIGAGSQSIYDGATLARRGDVVVVTINYRLGVLGFLDLGDARRAAVDRTPASSTRSPRSSGCATHRGLRWRPRRRHDLRRVGRRHERRHAARLPAARGLFHKAIPQSGSCQAIHDHESAATATTAFLAGLGLATPNVQELRAVPVEKLIQGSRRSACS